MQICPGTDSMRAMRGCTNMVISICLVPAEAELPRKRLLWGWNRASQRKLLVCILLVIKAATTDHLLLCARLARLSGLHIIFTPRRPWHSSSTPSWMQRTVCTEIAGALVWLRPLLRLDRFLLRHAADVKGHWWTWQGDWARHTANVLRRASIFWTMSGFWSAILVRSPMSAVRL